MNFELICQLILNKFIVDIYRLQSNSSFIPELELNNLIQDFNTYEYPRQILEELMPLNGIARIDIFDKNNILLLTNSILIEE